MKDKIKLVIVFLLGIMISVVISVYAATVIGASEVSFNGGTSNIKYNGTTAANVSDAINGVYTSANTLASNLSTHTSYSSIPVSSSYNIATNNSFIYGKLITLSIRITGLNNKLSNSAIVLASINSTYAPASAVYFGYGSTNHLLNYASYCFIEYTGAISCTGSNNNDQIMINMSYYKA